MSLWNKVLSGKGKLEFIAIDKLIKSPLNVRKDYGDLEGLKKSIKSKGLLQPLIVRKIDNKYEVIVGERRRKALSELAEEDPHFKLVPCLVVDISDEEAAKLSLIENIQRKSISPEEQAAGIRLLKEKFGLSEERIAEEIAIAAAEVRRLVDLYATLKELGLTLEKKAGRGRQILIETTVEEKAPEVVPEVKKIEEKEVIEVKPRVKEVKKEEIDKKLEELKRKVPFSHALMISTLCDWLIEKGVISREERNEVMKYFLQVAVEHSLKQVELRELCKRVRQGAREKRSYKTVTEEFLKERYSTVEVRIKIPRTLYIELEEKAKSENKSIDDIIVEVLSKSF